MHFPVEETTTEKSQIEDAQNGQAITLIQCVAGIFPIHFPVEHRGKKNFHEFCCHCSAVAIGENVSKRTLICVSTLGAAACVTSPPLPPVFARPTGEFSRCCELSAQQQAGHLLCCKMELQEEKCTDR